MPDPTLEALIAHAHKSLPSGARISIVVSHHTCDVFVYDSRDKTEGDMSCVSYDIREQFQAAMDLFGVKPLKGGKGD